nr:copia protein [Tanacetum cinerariifolium]
MLLYKKEARIQLRAKQVVWRDDTDDEPDGQELEAHYMYMENIQEVTPNDADNSRPTFDAKPLQKLVEIIQFIVHFGYSKHMTRNLKLLSFRDTNLYSITLQDTTSPNLICLMAKATLSEAWLWHRRLSHLNFDSINLLSKNDIVIGLPKLKFVKDHLFLLVSIMLSRYDHMMSRDSDGKSRIDDDGVLDVLSLDSRKSRIDDDDVLDVLSLDSRNKRMKTSCLIKKMRLVN